MINLSISDLSDDDKIAEDSTVGFRPKINFKVRHVKRKGNPNANPSSPHDSQIAETEQINEKEGSGIMKSMKRRQNNKSEDEKDDDILSDLDMVNLAQTPSSFPPKSRKVEGLLLITSDEEDDDLDNTTKEQYFEKYGYYGKNEKQHKTFSETKILDTPAEESISSSTSMPTSNIDYTLRNKEIAEALFNELDEINDSENEMNMYSDAFEIGLGKDKLKILCCNSSYELALSKFTSKVASLRILKEKTDAEVSQLTKEYEQILSKQRESIAKAFKMP